MPWRAKSHLQRQRERLGRRHADREYEERRRRNPALARADKIRRSSRWKKVRALKLARDPLCEDCKEHGVTTPAEQVHHLVGLAERPDLAFVLENTRSLCTTCHARREAEVRRD